MFRIACVYEKGGSLHMCARVQNAYSHMTTICDPVESGLWDNRHCMVSYDVDKLRLVTAVRYLYVTISRILIIFTGG
jgi:hypothetical protein